VHITISEPSPEAKPNVVLPLSLDEGGDVAARCADRKQQQHQLLQQQAAANVSITITDASPESACGARPLPAANVQQQAGPTAHNKRLAFRRASEAKIVQHKALVHRTSEGPHS